MLPVSHCDDPMPHDAQLFTHIFTVFGLHLEKCVRLKMKLTSEPSERFANKIIDHVTNLYSQWKLTNNKTVTHCRLSLTNAVITGTFFHIAL